MSHMYVKTVLADRLHQTKNIGSDYFVCTETY